MPAFRRTPSWSSETASSKPTACDSRRLWVPARSARRWWARGWVGSAGLSLGHSFAKNVWLSFGYNFAGFEDEDFAQARYTANGPYIQFRIKFDQDSLRDLSRLATAPLAPPTPVR